MLHEFGGTKIIVREVFGQGNELRGVLLWIPDEVDGGFLNGQAIFAKFGLLKFPQNRHSRLVLTNGVTTCQQGNRRKNNALSNVSDNNSQKLSCVSTGRPTTCRDVNTSTYCTRRKREGGRTVAPNAVEELHNRLAYPAPCLVFGLLAVPLALMGQRFSRKANGETAATSADFLVSNAPGTKNPSSVVVNLMSA